MRRRLVTFTAFALIGVIISFGSAWAGVLFRVFVAKPFFNAPDGGVEPAPWPLNPPAGWPEPDSVQVTRGWAYERRVADGVACQTPQGLRNYREVLREWREHAAAEQMKRAETLARLRDQITRDPSGQALRDYRSRVLAGSVPPPTGGIENLSQFRRRSGWPFLCMQSSWSTHASRATGTPAPVNTFGHRWTLGMYWNRGIPWPRTVNAGHFNLPVRPVWDAFALNAAFWGFLGWVLLQGLWMARGRARSLRGVCPRCLYPVGVSDVCTECGLRVGQARDAAHL